MKKPAVSLNHFWSDFRPFIFAGIVVLALVRTITLCLNLPASIGELWRPLLEQPAWAGWAATLTIVITAFCIAGDLKKASDRLKTRFMVFYGGLYLIMALFNNHVDRFGYLYHLMSGRLELDGLQSLLTMDLFFQPPWIFWNLCWMGLSGYYCHKHNCIERIVYFWAVPFLWFRYSINNVTFVFFISSLIAGLTGRHLFRSVSSARLHVFSGVVFCALLYLLNNNPIVYRATWLVALIQMPLVWILSFWFIRQCEQEDTSDAIAITWLIPLVAGTVLNQTLFTASLGNSFFNFWFMIASLNYVAGILPAIVFLLITAGLISLIRPLPAKLFFVIGILAMAIFYLADGILMYKNGLRLTYYTLDWVWGLNNPLSIVHTAFELIEWQLAALFVFIPAVAAVLFIKAGGAQKNTTNYRFGSTFVYLMVLAQTASTGFQTMTVYPSAMRDPVKILMASIPAASFSGPPMPLQNLLKQFSEARITFNQLQKPISINDDRQKKNIILIMLESTSNRYLSLFGHNELTWPKLESYKERLEIFPYFFSCFPESSNADFATTSGLYPPDTILLRQMPEFNSTILIDRLKAAGYDCSMYFAGFIGDTNLASYYMPRGFNRLYDANSLPDISREDGWVWGVKEHVMAERVTRQIEEQAKTPDRPFFIYYRMVFPHLPFDAMSNEAPKKFSEEDYLKGSWVGRFKNCLLYQDAQIARIIEQVDKSGLRGNTAIVIVGDHGTSLGEAGLFGHGWHLAPESTNVPLVIVHPENTGFRVNQTSAAQIDIRPTILALAGVDNSRPDFSQGYNLLEPVPASRSIFLTSMQHRAIVENDHYFLIQTSDPKHSMVFKLNKDSGPHRFTKRSDWPLEDLAARYDRFSHFLELQWHLLTHISHFDNELNKLR